VSRGKEIKISCPLGKYVELEMGRLIKGSRRYKSLEHAEKLCLIRGLRKKGIHSRIQTQLLRGLLTVRAECGNLKNRGREDERHENLRSNELT